jgi:hypothetical protein
VEENMKKKAFRKRLVLSKTTVVNLDAAQMGGIDIGGTLVKTACPPCETAVYNCTTVDPMRVCLTTCNCGSTEPDTSVEVPCRITDCC